MELQDKVLLSANVPSLSILPSMLNSSPQMCGLNAALQQQQQPLLIPWSNAVTNPTIPLTVMPVLNQPLATPLPAPVSPVKDSSLILFPVSPGSSQGIFPQSNLLGSPISIPTLQRVSAPCKNNNNNNPITPSAFNCGLPLAVKSVSSLPVLNQTLLQSQSVESSNAANNVSISNLCHLTGSSPQEMMAINFTNSCAAELLKGKRKLEFNSQGRSSTSPKRAKTVMSPKPNPSFSSVLSVQTGNNNSDTFNDDQSFIKQQSCDGKAEQTQPDKDSISRIISSLPPGWKVVGLTSLDNSNTHLAVGGSDGNPVALSSGTLPIVQTRSLQQNSSPPDVVSVDLNVSPTLPSAMSSPIAMDSNVSMNAGSNMNKCSVHLCDSLSDKLISVKSEMMEVDEVAWDKSTRSNPISDRSSELFAPTTAVSAPIKIEPKSWAASEPENVETCLQMPADSQWTVVGVTSIPGTPVTPAAPLTQNVLNTLSPLISTSSSGSQVPSYHYQCNGSSLGAISPKTAATILNVPLPKVGHSARQGPTGSAVNSEISLPRPTISNVCNTDIANPNPAMKEEWTIVGVTVCPSPVKSPNIYSNAGTTGHIASVDKSQSFLDLNTISLDGIKSQLVGQSSNNQQVNSNITDILKALSLPTHARQENKFSNVFDHLHTNSGDEWKVVGITQLPDEQNVAKWSENSQLSNVPAGLSSSISTLPTITTSMANSNSSNSFAESILNNALGAPSDKSLMSTILDSDTQQKQLLHQLFNAQLQHQQQQQQQLLQQHHQQSLQQEQKISNSMPLLSPQITNSNSISTLSFLNQFQDLMDVLRNDRMPENGHANFPMNKPPTPSRDVNEALGCQEPSPSHINMMPSENSKSSLSSFDLKSHKPKLPYIDRCSGKSDCASRKSKDMCVRCMKKHTVSHLLKMKRTKGKDHSECEDDGDNFECVGQNFKIVKRLSDKILRRLTTNRVDRDGRSRPLHSYAGNRKLFSKPFSRNKNSPLERISLRSGTQVPVSSYESDFNESEFHSNDTMEAHSADFQKKDSEGNSVFYPEGEMRSAARKRKLKVPRKMVADRDYQPFDSSSDSN